jgi:hypothetical protein
MINSHYDSEFTTFSFLCETVSFEFHRVREI